MKPQFITNLDSLIKLAGYSEGMEAMQQLDRSLADSLRTKAKELERPLSEKQKKQIDSLWTIQTKIDSLNTIQLIATIETLGIDSLNKVDGSCDENSLFIFVHCPDGLKEKVRKVITEHKEAVGENRFRHISWHLEGRKGG